MRVYLQSTTRVIDVVVGDAVVRGRVWEGHTEGGIEVAAIVTRITTRADNDLRAFELELDRMPDVAPNTEAAVKAWPHRLVL